MGKEVPTWNIHSKMVIAKEPSLYIYIYIIKYINKETIYIYIYIYIYHNISFNKKAVYLCVTPH